MLGVLNIQPLEIIRSLWQLAYPKYIHRKVSTQQPLVVEATSKSQTMKEYLADTQTTSDH